MLQTSDIYFSPEMGGSLSFPALKFTCPGTPSYKSTILRRRFLSFETVKVDPVLQSGDGSGGVPPTSKAQSEPASQPETASVHHIMCLSAQHPS